MRYALICHPDTPSRAIEQVTVDLASERTGVIDTGALWFEFHVSPSDRLLLPAPAKPERTDDLWKSTCFELFAKPAGGEAYFEFNFSPSFEWAAYAFDGHRAGRRELASHDPEIVISPASPHFFLAVEAMPALPPGAMQIGFSAVIEETDGTISYWALAHPPGKADFHDPACFALELPAAV